MPLTLENDNGDEEFEYMEEDAEEESKEEDEDPHNRVVRAAILEEKNMAIARHVTEISAKLAAKEAARKMLIATKV
jgi:hypothetical protein